MDYSIPEHIRFLKTGVGVNMLSLVYIFLLLIVVIGLITFDKQTEYLCNENQHHTGNKAIYCIKLRSISNVDIIVLVDEEIVSQKQDQGNIETHKKPVYGFGIVKKRQGAFFADVKDNP